MNAWKITPILLVMLAGFAVPARGEDEDMLLYCPGDPTDFSPVSSAADDPSVTSSEEEEDVVSDEFSGSGCSPDCCTDSCANCSTGCGTGCCRRCPRTYVQADVLFFGRNNRSGNRALVFDVNEPRGGRELLATRDLDFDFELGARALLRHHCSDCCALEASYFGIFDWAATETAWGDNSLAIPGDLGLASNDFFGADIMRVDYLADLHNGEVNFVKSCCSRCCNGGRRLSCFVGPRYLSLDEQFNIQSTDFDEGTSNYNIRVDNDLYGVQIGGRFERWMNRFGWEATGKAGIFGNDVRQNQFVTDFPPPFALRPRTGADGGRVAFVGDLSLSLTYRLTRACSLRGGYNVMWIEGVALAPDQLDFTLTPTSGRGLNDNGGLFLHGAHIGLEARW
jgi:hypothetical protein